MYVRHRFAGVGAVVEYEPEAVLRQAQLPRNFGGFQQQMTEQGLVFRTRFGNTRDGLLRDQKDVRRRLRGDVMEGDDRVVLINNPGRNFTRDDFLEQGLAHNVISREGHRRAGPAAGAPSLDHQRTRVTCGVNAHAPAEEFNDLVAELLAARTPALRAQQPLHAAAQAVKAN
jgi:hypothetical protein